MSERDGHLSLEQGLARRWDFEAERRAGGSSPNEVARHVAEVSSLVARRHPTWSHDQVRTALPFLYLTTDLREVSVSRRFALEDPAELGRGLAAHGRLRWLEDLIGGGADLDSHTLLDAFAVRDFALAEKLAAGESAVRQRDPEFLDLITLGGIAAYRRDPAGLRATIESMSEVQCHPWQEGICTCLEGVADQQPHRVAQGLAQHLEGLQRLREKDELEEAINLTAHGLYRLCEWISPPLVAEFDATRPLPWDAEFHAWCQQHPDPLGDVDFRGISPLLHDAVVRLRLPTWWEESGIG